MRLFESRWVEDDAHTELPDLPPVPWPLKVAVPLVGFLGLLAVVALVVGVTR